MSLRFPHLQSVKARITVATLAVFVLSSVVIGVFASCMMREELTRQLGAQQLAAVTLLAAQFDDVLNRRISALQARGAKIRPAMLANPAAAQLHLEDSSVLHPMFNAGLFVTRTDGTVIADNSTPPSSSSPSNRIGLNVSERDYMVAALMKAVA